MFQLSFGHHLRRCLLLLTMPLLPTLAVPPAADAHPGHDHQEDHQSSDAGVNPPGENKVAITIDGDYRVITSNGIPNHKTGQFPGRGNPNAISAQSYRYRMPLKPALADKPTSNEGGPFGIALNGVVFDPTTAEFWKRDRNSGWREEAISPTDQGQLGLDMNRAHVQPTGAYHYHGIPTGLVEHLAGGKEHVDKKMVLVGYAADGFPIYNRYAYKDASDPKSDLVEMKPSYQLKKGNRPGGNEGPGGAYDGKYSQDYEFVQGSGNLDMANGRSGVTPEYPDGTYYYVLTIAHPSVPRYWMGTPDDSFRRRGPRGGGPGGPGGPGGRAQDDRGGERPDGPPPRRGGGRRPPPPGR